MAGKIATPVPSRRSKSTVPTPAPEKIRPAPRRWQKILLLLAALALVAWMVILALLAWK